MIEVMLLLGKNNAVSIHSFVGFKKKNGSFVCGEYIPDHLNGRSDSQTKYHVNDHNQIITEMYKSNNRA